MQKFFEPCDLPLESDPFKSIDISIRMSRESPFDLENATMLFSSATHAWFEDEGGTRLLAFGPVHVRQRSFLYSHDIWHAKCSCDMSKVELYVPEIGEIDFHRELFRRPWLQRVCCARLGPDMSWAIVHGACVKLSTGLLLLGDSGSGKSTLSELCSQAGYEIISDDRVMLRIFDDSVVVMGTPWNHRNPAWTQNRGVSAGQILFLEHGSENKFTIIPLEDAINRIIRQLYMPLPSDSALPWCMAIASKLSRRLSTKVFSLVPDQSAVQELKTVLTRT